MKLDGAGPAPYPRGNISVGVLPKAETWFAVHVWQTCMAAEIVKTKADTQILGHLQRNYEYAKDIYAIQVKI